VHAIGEQMDETIALVKGDSHSMAERVRQIVDRMKSMEKEVEQLKSELAKHKGANLTDSVVEINGVKVLVSSLEGADPKSLRGMVDDLKNRLGSGIVVLAVADGNKVSLIAGVTKDLTGSVKAGELVNMLAQQVGGKGGGRPDMAQAGGTDVAALPAALASVDAWLSERL
jgi:alanyl-tRNA synthetase